MAIPTPYIDPVSKQLFGLWGNHTAEEKAQVQVPCPSCKEDVEVKWHEFDEFRRELTYVAYGWKCSHCPANGTLADKPAP